MILDDGVQETAYGLNDKRPNLLKLLADPTLETMLV